jgi:hypothetical protein
MWDHILFEIDDNKQWYFITYDMPDTVCDSYMWLNEDGSWTQSHTYNHN